LLSVRDRSHLDAVLRQLKRTPAVIKAERIFPQA
jgi:(p)ppGpp synthase/HD superfamily hydrolase